jgi:hypothetical protein
MKPTTFVTKVYGVPVTDFQENPLKGSLDTAEEFKKHKW